MANNEVENNLPTTAVNDVDEQEMKTEQKPYSAPNFVHYGALAELVKINPGSGPDGGTGDCQHN